MKRVMTSETMPIVRAGEANPYTVIVWSGDKDHIGVVERKFKDGGHEFRIRWSDSDTTGPCKSLDDLINENSAMLFYEMEAPEDV